MAHLDPPLKEQQTFILKQVQQLKPNHEVSSIAFLRDGRLATGSGTIVSIWETDRQGWLHQVQQLKYNRHNGYHNSMAFSCNGRLAIPDNMTGVFMWETDWRGRLQQVQQLETGRIVTSLAFSPNGHQLVTGGGNPISIWEKDLQGRLQQVQRLNHGHSVKLVAFSRDGQLMTAGQGKVLIWQAN
jgi:WD40 repeat protein